MKLFISGGLLVILLSINISAWRQPKAKVLPYQDKNQTVEARIIDLLSRMTVEEKAMQLTNTKALKFRLMQKNTGKVKGDEIVQLYLRDEYASVSRPLKELKGFQRISLASGKTKTVILTLTPDELMMLNKEMIWVVELGAFTVMIGASCEDIRLTSTFEVIK